MKKSTVTVQQWIESLPPPEKPVPPSNSPPNLPQVKTPKKFLPRELSLQSDDTGSHCSSVESVLELRKPNPEAILMSLGFGPSKPSGLLSKIPQRFLKPSKLITNIDLDKFLEQYGESSSDLSQNSQSPFAQATARQRPF